MLKDEIDKKNKNINWKKITKEDKKYFSE